MGNMVKVSIERYDDNQINPTSFVCDSQSIKGLRAKVDGLKSLSSEHFWLQNLWIRKLLELAGPGVLESKLCSSLGNGACYESATLYARSSIALLETLDVQLNCLLNYIQNDSKFINEFLASDIYTHMSLMRGMIANGWWNVATRMS